jgi:hypothetical protein
VDRLLTRERLSLVLALNRFPRSVGFTRSLIVDEVAVEVDEEGRREVVLVDPAREEEAGRMKPSLRVLRGVQEGMGWCLMMHLDVIAIGTGTGIGTEIDGKILVQGGIGMIDEEAGIGMRGMKDGDLGRGAQTIGIGIATGMIGIGIGGEVEVNENGIIEIGGDSVSKRVNIVQQRLCNDRVSRCRGTRNMTTKHTPIPTPTRPTRRNLLRVHRRRSHVNAPFERRLRHVRMRSVGEGEEQVTPRRSANFCDITAHGFNDTAFLDFCWS